MDNQYNGGSRSRYRTKRKKTNIFLNSLIGIVILLILIVGYTIFAGGDKTAPAPSEKNSTETNKGNSSSGEQEKTAANDENEEDSTEKTDQEAADDEDTDGDDEQDSDENTEPVITEGGDSPNVKRTIENPGWKPVGTSQSGEHTADFNDESQDWQEMLSALSYAIGTDPSNMTTWWLEGNNGNPNAAIGTVSAKGEDQAYRVYIEWVEGQGWKPVRTEELIVNDKGQQ